MFRWTIFLIEDDPTQAETIGEYLRESGLRVEHFDSAEAFLAQTRLTSHSILVTDYCLGGICGTDLVERVRGFFKGPIIVRSGETAPDLAERALAAGADLFLHKSEPVDRLVKSIKGLARRMTTQHQPV